jgi:hypothetical protein
VAAVPEPSKMPPAKRPKAKPIDDTKSAEKLPLPGDKDPCSVNPNLPACQA